MGSLIGAASCAALGAGPARASLSDARLSLHNIHTGERLNRLFRTPVGYDPGALSEFNTVLRDFRTGETHTIAPQLLDLVYDLSVRLDFDGTFDVISGYRSPATNAKLRAGGHGVASKSFHMRGMAIDIAAPGVKLRDIYNAALGMRRGGVGIYEASGFVHVDIGPVRTWS